MGSSIYETGIEKRENEPRLVEQFVVLDLDRTLLATDNLVEIIYQELVKVGIPLSRAASDKEHILRQTGTSFSLLEHMVHEYGEATLHEVISTLTDASKNDKKMAAALLCPGASELVSFFDRSNTPHAILTYGERSLQEFKLALFRNLLNKTEAELPATVTAESKKAEWIADAWNRDDLNNFYQVPDFISGSKNIYAKNIVIVDDKRSNLQTSAEGIKGVLVNNADSRPEGSMTTEELCRYLEGGLPLLQVAHFQAGQLAHH